jgi:hypothetical protein
MSVRNSNDWDNDCHDDCHENGQLQLRQMELDEGPLQRRPRCL